MQQIRFIRTCEGSYVAYANQSNLACLAASRREAFQTLRRFMAVQEAGPIPAIPVEGKRIGKTLLFRPSRPGHHPSMKYLTQTTPTHIHSGDSI